MRHVVGRNVEKGVSGKDKLQKRKKQQRRGFGHKKSCLTLGFVPVTGCYTITLYDVQSGMQGVKGARVAQGLFENLMKTVGHEAMVVFVSLSEHIWTEHLSHDSGRSVTVTFVK